MESININKIIIDSILEKQSLIFSFICLFGGYLLQDVVFVKEFGKFIADIPGFLKNANYKNIMTLVTPYLLSTILFYIDDIIQAKVIPEIELSIATKITEQMLDSLKTSKTTIDVNEFIINLKKIPDLKNIYAVFISYVIPTILIGLGILYYFTTLGYKITTLYIIVITILSILTYAMETECVPYAQDCDNSLNVFYSNIQDVMVNHDSVTTSNTKDYEMDNINTVQDVCQNKYQMSETINSESLLKLTNLNMLAMIILDGVVVNEYLNGHMQLQSVISVIMMISTFMQYYNSTVVRLKNIMGHIGKYFEVVDYFGSYSIDKKHNANKLKITYGNIDFRNISVSYENNKILDKFNLHVPGNKIFGIIGDIGSGKTSLLKILAGLTPYTGQILIDNQDISKCSIESVMNNISYITQHVKLFDRTIFDNINYGSSYSKQQIWDIIKKYGLYDFYNGFPNKLDTDVGKEGVKLSGGQKQLLVITRALIQDKKIILLDEPTSSLNDKYKTYLIDLLTSIKGKTIIIVTHDKSTMKMFDDHIEFK